MPREAGLILKTRTPLLKKLLACSIDFLISLSFFLRTRDDSAGKDSHFPTVEGSVQIAYVPHPSRKYFAFAPQSYFLLYDDCCADFEFGAHSYFLCDVCCADFEFAAHSYFLCDDCCADLKFAAHSYFLCDF